MVASRSWDPQVQLPVPQKKNKILKVASMENVIEISNTFQMKTHHLNLTDVCVKSWYRYKCQALIAVRPLGRRVLASIPPEAPPRSC